MYDYMSALEDRVSTKSNYAEQRKELEAKRQAVSALLDKQGRKKLLRLVDAHTAMQEEMAPSSFIADFAPGSILCHAQGAEYGQRGEERVVLAGHILQETDGEICNGCPTWTF